MAIGHRPSVAQAASAGAGAQSPAGPATLDARARDEARQRFDRGLTLYNQGDFIGALAEFQVAHKLTGHPMVLFNLALVRARLGHSSEAVDALEKLRALPGAELAPAIMERVQALYEAQLSRVGTLEIKTSTPRALVQIDNVAWPDACASDTAHRWRPLRFRFRCWSEPRHLRLPWRPTSEVLTSSSLRSRPPRPSSW